MNRFIRKLIRRLVIGTFLVSLLLVAGLYAIGKVPIHYALNLANVTIPHNIKLSGTLARGTLQAADAYSSEPQIVNWQRQNLIAWAISLEGPWVQGDMLAKPRPSGLLFEQINLSGDTEAIQPHLSNLNIKFDFQSYDVSSQISWMQPMILFTSGRLDINNAQIEETQGWQSLGDFQALFHTESAQTFAKISSHDNNGFTATGEIGIDFANRDQTPPTADLIIDGHFNNPNKQLLFPWAIPISGKKSALGYPVQSTFTLPLR